VTDKPLERERRLIPLSHPSPEPHLCTPAVRLEMLGRAPLFADLTPDELAEVDRRCHVHGFVAGEAVYHSGTPASRVYVVASGAVKTVRLAADGRETLLDLCGPGEPLGAVPALGEEFHAESAWTLTPTCLLGLNANEYAQIMEDFPAVAMATLKGVSRRLSESREAVHLLAGAPLPQRLAAMLLLLAEKVGRPWEGGVLIDVPLSRDDLASMAGAATESVSRVLSSWKRSGSIDSGRRWIAITDDDKLRALRDG
jgi:CRP-like cAMP-binding protein